MKVVLYLLTFVLTLNCSSTKFNKQEIDSKIEQLAISHFGKKYASKENSTGRYMLVWRKYKKMEEMMGTVDYFIFDKKTQKIIFEDHLNAGTVKWSSDYEIIAIARNIHTEQNSYIPKLSYIFNVIEGKKRVID